jgi:hypothetical protein
VLEHYPERKKLSPYSAIALKSIKVLALPWRHARRLGAPHVRSDIEARQEVSAGAVDDHT